MVPFSRRWNFDHAAAPEDGRTPTLADEDACATTDGLNHSRSGFTLIEMVISGGLMAMVLVSAYICLNASFSSRKLIETRAEAIQGARVALSLISADLRSACALSKDSPFLGMHRIVEEVEADNLDFATHYYTPRRAREGDWCEVSYFLERNPVSGKFSLWRRRDATPDDDPLAGGTREELASGIRGLKFEYYDGFEWFDEWGDPSGRRRSEPSALDPGNLTGMPEAVRITLAVEVGGEARAKTSEEKEAPEPPLVFQTVARLNLAALWRQGGFAGSVTNAGAASGASGGFPPGGQP